MFDVGVDPAYQENSAASAAASLKRADLVEEKTMSIKIPRHLPRPH